MEEIHGVDVSWLHHINKDQNKVTSSSSVNSRNASPSALPYEAFQEVQANKLNLSTSNPEATSVAPSAQTQPSSKPTSRRPGVGKRASSGLSGEKSGADEGKPSSKRTGWISSLSSKFSSQSQQNGSTINANGSTRSQQGGAQLPSPPMVENSLPATHPTRSFSKSPTEALEELVPYVPHQPKPGGSFLGALRRLSTAGPPTMSKATVNCNAVCPRRTLNIDQHRQRCALRELDQSRLRRVAFSVDVEIAGGPRYFDSDESSEKFTTSKDKKLFDKGEGDALKNPEAAKEAKDKIKTAKTSAQEVSKSAASNASNPPEVDSDFDGTDPYEMLEKANADERRLQRSEKKRRRSEDAGALLKEAIHSQDMNIFGTANPNQDGFASAIPAQEQIQRPQRAQARPTTDPLRVYRRCCQLREAPVLKRISEQLGNTANCSVETVGVVNCLDLTGSRMQLSDVVCLADWLAVVPVKKLLLEDANLTDEGVRIVLAGLLAARIPGQAKRKHTRSSPSRLRDIAARPLPGVIEKITLKNNPKITRSGWGHICVFINMSSSVKAIDVSLIPFPQSSVQGDNLSNAKTSPDALQPDMAELLSKSLSGRIASPNHLEELIVAECNLSAPQVGNIIDGVISIRLARLGLASNHLDGEGLAHVARYIHSGACKGLDLGGNDLRGRLGVIADAMGKVMWALSLANCNLDSSSLVPLFTVLIKVPDFRFIDLSHNRDLFHTPSDQTENGPAPTTLGILRRYLPHLPSLRRIHLMDVGLSPADAIGLAEVLPEGRNLNHISILENPKLTALASAAESSAQEEACALYASLMVAARVSKMLFCIDVDIPSHESSEMVKALARQVVAYTLRNMERYTAADAITSTDPASVVPDLSETDRENVPDALMHLLWPVQETDTPLPDHDYIVGGTGLVKALDYVLDQKNADIRRPSTSVRPDTPSQVMDSERKAKAKEMSKNLLESARKIRTRLQPAIAREAESGDEMAYRRLQMLNQTLEGMIERFEDDYPECRKHPTPPHHIEIPLNTDAKSSEPFPSYNRSRASIIMKHSLFSDQRSFNSKHADPLETEPADPSPESPEPTYSDTSPKIMPLRRASETPLDSRALAIEEGNMHRLGQRFRREILPPTGIDDQLHGTSTADPPEPEHLQEFRRRVGELEAAEIVAKVKRQGLDATIREYKEDAEALRSLERSHPEGFGRVGEETQAGSQLPERGRLPGKWNGSRV